MVRAGLVRRRGLPLQAPPSREAAASKIAAHRRGSVVRRDAEANKQAKRAKKEAKRDKTSNQRIQGDLGALRERISPLSAQA